MFQSPPAAVSSCLYPPYLRLLPSLVFVDLVVVIAEMSSTTHGPLTLLHENGLSYNALGPFHPPVQVMLLSSSAMLCMSLVVMPLMGPT